MYGLSGLDFKKAKLKKLTTDSYTEDLNIINNKAIEKIRSSSCPSRYKTLYYNKIIDLGKITYSYDLLDRMYELSIDEESFYKVDENYRKHFFEILKASLDEKSVAFFDYIEEEDFKPIYNITLDAILNNIIMSDVKGLGPRRGLFFALELGLDIIKPLTYSLNTNDCGLLNIYESYLENPSKFDIVKLINVHIIKSEREKNKQR